MKPVAHIIDRFRVALARDRIYSTNSVNRLVVDTVFQIISARSQHSPIRAIVRSHIDIADFNKETSND